jgi:hypothetical protein
VTLSWSAEALGFDPLADLLAYLGPPAAPGERTLHLELRPARAETALDPAHEGLLPSFFHGVIQAYRTPEGFLLWDRGSRVRVPEGGAPIVAELLPAAHEPVAGSTAAMLQIALALGLRRFQLFHAHAAALVTPDGRSVLVAGGSGAGKTTTTLALLEAGCAYLGDDALFLHRVADDEGTLEALAFPREFHLGHATLGAFPRLAALVGPVHPRSDKRPLDPRRAYPGQAREGLRFTRGQTELLFPSIGAEAHTALHPLSKAEAFGLLLSSSAALVIEGMPRRDENLVLLRTLLDGARCREIVLGRDALVDPAGAVASV